MRRALWILAVLLSHWRRHPMQLATLLIGLISATALWSGVQALNQQARNAYDRAAATFGGARTADAGRPRRRDLPATTVRRSAPRRLAGLAGARRPHPDRRALVPPARHRAGDAAGAKSATRRAIGKADLQSFMTPPGEMLVAPETLSDLKLAGGRDAVGQRRRGAAAAARAAATGARRAGGRYRHRAEPAENAGSAFAPADRQGQRQARAAGKRRRRPAAPGRARCGERSRTPHRQFSPQPDRVRTAVVLRRPVHRQFGDRARLRAAPADAAHPARLRRLGADAERACWWSNWCRWRWSQA